jgi:ABC-type branched-subunit amino acid transport system permease subunit
MATNAASDKPTEQASEMTTVFGVRIPTEQIWKVAVGIAVAALFVLVIILVLMPSGFSFLAAKNATGLLSYMGLFASYMLSFLFIVTAFFALVVGVLYAVYGPR